VREVHDHGHGATVLPYDRQNGTVLLVRQFRLPVQIYGEDGFIIEACAGLLDGNDPAECAKREAEEELGFRLSNLRHMITTYATPGCVTERIALFIADYDHEARISGGGGHPHEGEDIEVLEIPFAEMRQMVKDGRITDAKTVMLGLFLERELGLPPL
jgi:GDP-mannose pyrophosphatase NudK